MKTANSKNMFKPFAGLKTMLEERSVLIRKDSRRDIENTVQPASAPVDEMSLFEEAMSGVKEIQRDNCVEKELQIDSAGTGSSAEDTDVMLELKRLVADGTGFRVADTPEYMEGVGYRTHPEISKRLHRGEFSIQGHLDLHGMSADEAQCAIETFLKEGIKTGKRTLLIIHGRGLSSPSKPVLKTRVSNLLSSGSWRKWILAFTSARWCDGGAGATYVLLRRRPLTKKLRKIPPQSL